MGGVSNVSTADDAVQVDMDDLHATNAKALDSIQGEWMQIDHFTTNTVVKVSRDVLSADAYPSAIKAGARGVVKKLIRTEMHSSISRVLQLVVARLAGECS